MKGVFVFLNRAGRLISACYECLRVYLTKDAAPDAQESPAPLIDTFASAELVQSEFERAFEAHQQGKLDEAASIYRSLLLRQPNQFDNLLRMIRGQPKKLTAAADLIVRSLNCDPDNSTAHFQLGSVLRAQGRSGAALASFDKALALDADNVETITKRGAVLSELGRHEEAMASCDRALAINPDAVDALFNRGHALSALGKSQQALESFECVLAINPDNAIAQYNRGVVLSELMRFEEALASYDHALAIRPDYVHALNNRGDLLSQFMLHERAAKDYSRLVEIEPDYEYALGNKLHANLQICNWKQFSTDSARLFKDAGEGRRAGLPFHFVAISNSGPEQLTCARSYVAHKCPPMKTPIWTGERYRHDRIRVAYLSADLSNHAVASLMAELFEKHDRSKFEVSAWSFTPDTGDDMRARLRKSFEQFNDVGRMTDIDVATLLRKQEIDIAIDLMGFTTGCRTDIFAHRAVPIQVNYLGYVGTMGADYMDYIIGDASVIPVEHEAFYAEKVVRMPDTYQVNDSKRVIADRTPSRAEVKLPESGFVFCCFNNNYKIMPDVFDVWMRLLKRVDGSVLWLVGGNTAISSNLRLEAEARGVRADRLVFAARVPTEDYLARYRLADIFLDTLPYNAGTTASDALWAGLPVLTRPGNAFAGRMAASLLRAVGLPELITENLADYEALAFKLATTPAMLNDLKAKLARNRNTYPLFDTDRFRRHIESAYTTMYERYQRGEPPQSFSVQAIP